MLRIMVSGFVRVETDEVDVGLQDGTRTQFELSCQDFCFWFCPFWKRKRLEWYQHVH